MQQVVHGYKTLEKEAKSNSNRRIFRVSTKFYSNGIDPLSFRFELKKKGIRCSRSSSSASSSRCIVRSSSPNFFRQNK